MVIPEDPDGRRAGVIEEIGKKDINEQGEMLTYRNAILALQVKMDPLLIKQLVAETGKGVSAVVGPMVLEHIYLPSHLLPDRPAFEATDEGRKAALLMLVEAMETAESSHILDKAMLIFLKSSGVEEMRMKIEGRMVVLSWKAGVRRTSSYKFGEEVRRQFCSWAKAQVEERFGGV